MQDHKTQVFTITFYEYLSLFLLFPLKRVKRYIFTEVSSLQRRTSIFRRAQQMFTQLRDPEFTVSILWFDMCTFLLYIFFPNTFIFTLNLF